MYGIKRSTNFNETADLIKFLCSYKVLPFIIQNNVQLIAHQTIHFGLCTALISRALALIPNCKCIA
jgi:hypothetical protein